MAPVSASDIGFNLVDAEGLKQLPIDPSRFECLRTLEKATDNHRFLCASRNGAVVGVIKLYAPRGMSNLHVEYFEIDPEFRGQGISELLYGKLFEIAHAEHKTITSDGRTEEGRSYLSRIIERNLKKYGNEAYCVIGRV